MTSSGPSPSCGSPAWTLTQTRSQSSCIRSRTNSVASSIAPSLKYCPNEKLPSISKNVRWCASSPTSSMSGVRKHFWEVVVSGAGGVLEAEEVRHLRLHARGREQRRMIVGAGNERGRRDAQVALLLEEGEEALAQLRGRLHAGIVRTGVRQLRRYAAGGTSRRRV